MRYFRLGIFFLMGLTVLSLRLPAQDSLAKHYKIYDTRIRQLVTVDQIVQDMAEADVLFFGEEHNDSAAHFLEQLLFKQLYARYPAELVLSMEMFETDNQLVLNEYLGGKIDESRFSKDLRLWTNYKDYRPMVEFARMNRIPVIAANPPRRYVNMVSRKGRAALDSLDPEAKSYLPPLPYDTLAGTYRDKFFEIMKGSPGANNPRVYHSQSLWDAGMAYSIYRTWKKDRSRKIFHCVGKFHTDEKLGTAAQLRQFNKKIRMLNISCFANRSFSNPAWEQFAHLADYIILTDPDLKRTY